MENWDFIFSWKNAKKQVLWLYIKMTDKKKKFIDVTAPGKKVEKGHLHPLTQAMDKACEIFQSMGFEIADGPELETEYYNFDALNIPANHPARAMQDTFWLKNPKNGEIVIKPEEGEHKSQKYLLRTQTSNVQIRYMEQNKLPFRIISPGRVFRMEATDATHETQFYQIEGLMIDKKTNISNLKAVVKIFLQRFFDDENIDIRFRASFFPFVEPGVEVDMKFKGKWLEIGGAGMVNPKVLDNVKLNSNEWQGFAFGIGIDRLVMIKHKIDDIRLFYSGDLRFLKQF